jgi:hypothetical protein
MQEESAPKFRLVFQQHHPCEAYDAAAWNEVLTQAMPPEVRLARCMTEIESVLNEPDIASLMWRWTPARDRINYRHDVPSDPISRAFHSHNGAWFVENLIRGKISFRSSTLLELIDISAVHSLPDGVHLMEIRADNQHHKFVLYLDSDRATVYSTWYGIKRFYIVKANRSEWIDQFSNAFGCNYSVAIPSSRERPLDWDRAIIYQTLWGIDAYIVRANQEESYTDQPTLRWCKVTDQTADHRIA